MKIETETVERLRDELMERGVRQTLVLSPVYEDLTRKGLLSAVETAAISRIDPVAEAMFLMMNADGDLADEEINVIRGAIRDLTDSGLRSGTIKVMLETYAKNVAIEGWQHRLESVAKQLAANRGNAETAYALVAAVALADQEVTLEENELIDRFAELLGISDERCVELLAMVRLNPDAPWNGER